MVNLTPARDKRPGELSGGMRQRVSRGPRAGDGPADSAARRTAERARRADPRHVAGRNRAHLGGRTGRPSCSSPTTWTKASMLADRIIPLSAGPGATLGPAFQVDIAAPARPQGHQPRSALQGDPPRRHRVTCSAPSGEQHTAITRKLVLPDIEPEDLSVAAPVDRRPTPARSAASEIKERDGGGGRMSEYVDSSTI